MTNPRISVTTDPVDEVDEVDQGAPASAPVPAAVASPLFNLRKIREEKLEKLFLDVQVPRWNEDGGPQIFVRLKPAKPDMVMKKAERRRVTKADDVIALTQADILAECCLGVFIKADGREFSLRINDAEGPLTKFDPDLAVALGLEPNVGAAAVVRALFVGGDGDLVQASMQLGVWSNVSIPQDDEETLGD
jgi:hypothetical protein